MAKETTLWISGHLAEKIRAHGAETYPHECCGALLGRDRDAAHPEAAREDVLDADKAAQAQGLEVIGWYHSHPDHPAQPSQYDQDHAWPWYSYIIVSVHHGAPQDMTSWRLSDDRQAFSPEGIEIRHSATV